MYERGNDSYCGIERMNYIWDQETSLETCTMILSDIKSNVSENIIIFIDFASIA
jgi:hypothetical protein